MKLTKLYKLMLLFLFVTRLFSVKDEKLNNKLELFSNVETKIKKNLKLSTQAQELKRSKKIQFSKEIQIVKKI